MKVVKEVIQMFGNKTLKTIALIICSAFIIGISSGTAQASVAGKSSIDKIIKRIVIYAKSQERERRENYEREHERNRGTNYRDDRNDRRGRHEPARSNYRPAPPPR